MSVFVCNLIFSMILCFFSSVLALFQNSSNSNNNNSDGKDNAEQSSATINNCIRCTHSLSLSFSPTFYLRAFIVVFPSSLALSVLAGSVILDLSGALPLRCLSITLSRSSCCFSVRAGSVAFLQLVFRSVDDVAPPTRPFPGTQAGRQHQ